MPTHYEACLRHAIIYKNILAKANDIYLIDIEKGLLIFNEHEANIRKAQKWVEQYFEQDDLVAQLCSDYANSSSDILRLHQKNQEESIKWLEIALKAAKRLNNKNNEINHLKDLAETHLVVGNFTKAIDFYEEAIEISLETNDPVRKIQTITGAADVYLFSNHNLDSFIHYYEEALLISREIDDKLLERGVLASISRAYWYVGNFHKAIDYYQQTIDINHSFGKKEDQIYYLGELARCYTQLKNYTKSIEIYQQQLLIIRQSNDKEKEPGLSIDLCK